MSSCDRRRYQVDAARIPRPGDHDAGADTWATPTNSHRPRGGFVMRGGRYEGYGRHGRSIQGRHSYRSRGRGGFHAGMGGRGFCDTRRESGVEHRRSYSSGNLGNNEWVRTDVDERFVVPSAANGYAHTSNRANKRPALESNLSQDGRPVARARSDSDGAPSAHKSPSPESATRYRRSEGRSRKLERDDPKNGWAAYDDRERAREDRARSRGRTSSRDNNIDRLQESRTRSRGRLNSREDIGDRTREGRARSQARTNIKDDDGGRTKEDRTRLRGRMGSGREEEEVLIMENSDRRREPREASSSRRENTVDARKAAKLKELQDLQGRMETAVREGDHLASRMEKNRMDREELSIQIDAIKKLLKLYSSRKTGAETTTAITTTTSSSSSSSSSNFGGGGGGDGNDDGRGDVTGRVGPKGTRVLGLITSMPGVDRTQNKTVRVDSENTSASSLNGRSSERTTLSEPPTARTRLGKSIVRDINSAITASVATRGSRGPSPTATSTPLATSLNIRRRYMISTNRSRKARVMAFNPVDQDAFAVCTSDQSVDLWRCHQSSRKVQRIGYLENATSCNAAHMAWNPSGTHLAVGHTGPVFTDDWAATLVAKDGMKRTKLRSTKHNRAAQAVAWVTPSKNNQDHLITGGEDGHVVIWTRVLDSSSDLHKVACLHNKHTSAVRSACCPSTSPTVVSGGADGRIVSYSIETASIRWEQLLRKTNEYHPSVNEILEFPDKPTSLLVSAVDTGKSHVLIMMDTRQPASLIHTAHRMARTRKDPTRPFSGYVFPSISPCGQIVACAGDWDGNFHLWDIRAGRQEPMQSVVVNSSARVSHTVWHPNPEARTLMSLSSGGGRDSKNFVLHLHAGLR